MKKKHDLSTNMYYHKTVLNRKCIILAKITIIEEESYGGGGEGRNVCKGEI